MKRFTSAYKEINYISKYNYGVINDTVEAAVEKIEHILAAESCRVDRIKDNVLPDCKEGINNEEYND